MADSSTAVLDLSSVSPFLEMWVVDGLHEGIIPSSFILFFLQCLGLKLTQLPEFFVHFNGKCLPFQNNCISLFFLYLVLFHKAIGFSTYYNLNFSN